MDAIRSRVVSAVTDWFNQSHLPDPRTPEQIEREKYILWHSKTGLYRRWMAIIPVFVAQSVLGSFYSTSIFNRWADSHVWGVPGANAGMFTSCVAFYGLGTIIFGAWVARHGAFSSVRRSLLLTPLGWGLASLATSRGSLWLLYLGYGVLHGLGCAHAYISTTAVLQQWYPAYKGFMSGLAVCGAGVGSYIWTSIGRVLLDPHGPYALTPPQVQALYAGLFAGLLALVLPFLRNPPPGWQAPEYGAGGASAPSDSLQVVGTGGEGEALAVVNKLQSCLSRPRQTDEQRGYSLDRDREYTFPSAVRTQEFALCCVLVYGCSIPGVVFLSSAADMTQNIFGYDPSYAALVTSWLNLANFTGRFMWGLATDLIGRKSFWLLSAGVQFVALAVMGPAIAAGNFNLWLLCFLSIGSLYGGNFGVLPAFLSDLYGPSISAATHGSMIAVWALSCITGIPIFTHYTALYSARQGGGTGQRIPLPEAYIVNSRWLCALPAIAALACLMLNVRREDRIARRADKESVRVRLGPYVCALRWQWLGPAAQREQYAQIVQSKPTGSSEASDAPVSTTGEDTGSSSSRPMGQSHQPESKEQEARPSTADDSTEWHSSGGKEYTAVAVATPAADTEAASGGVPTGLPVDADVPAIAGTHSVEARNEPKDAAGEWT